MKVVPVYNPCSLTAQPLLNGTDIHNARLATVLNPQHSCSLRGQMQKHLPDLCYPTKKLSNLSRASAKICLCKMRAFPQHQLTAGTPTLRKEDSRGGKHSHKFQRTSPSASYLPLLQEFETYTVSRLQHRHLKCTFSTVPWAAHNHLYK